MGRGKKKINKSRCECGAQAEIHHRDKNGVPSYRKGCPACRNTDRGIRGYKKHRKKYCEQCGFRPLHMCQLDVDHVDGNKDNNNLDNLRTLCANCHRLKTWLNKDNL